MRKISLCAMLVIFWGVSFAICLFGCASARTASSSPDVEKTAVERAVSKVFPALVRIHVVFKHSREGREAKFQAAGSGVIISRDGYVVTNHHVVGKAKWIRCTLASKDEADAELIGTDALADIAVIKLKPSTMKTPVCEFPFAEFGDSSQLKVGGTVFAMGSPLALSQSVTRGVVSNAEMIMPTLWGDDSFKLDDENVGMLVRWIGHDAAIYPGNSGGPLVDAQGKVVGINEIGVGLGGAIPSNLAHAVAEELTKNGEVRRSWIGADVRALLKSSGLDYGVLVSGVIVGSPAEKAGLKPGDLIIAYDGQPVKARWAEELPLFNRIIFETPVGKTVSVRILREGNESALEITTEARGKAREEDEEVKEWGATFRNISLLAAKELKRDATTGILVTSVRPGGPCGQAKPEITQGDIVLRVGNKEVKNLAELESITAEIVAGKTKPVPTVVSFERKTETILTVVKIAAGEREDVVPEARKAWFSASVQVFTRDLAETMGLPGKEGVFLTQVYPGQEAEKAGFKVGDIITHIDGAGVEASDPSHSDVFPNMIRRYAVGSRVEMTVIRDGVELKIPVELVSSPVPENQKKKYKDEFFDFTGREIAFIDCVREKWEKDQTGVYVSSVQEGGWAALAKMRVGDLLLSANGTPVNSIDELEKVIKNIVQEKPRYVVFFVKRGIHSLYLEVEPDWEQSK